MCVVKCRKRCHRLGVAEDEAGAVVVIGVPGYERCDGEEKRGEPVLALVFVCGAALKEEGCLP